MQPDNEESHVKWFEDMGMGDVPEVGGKNASLGELTTSLRSAGVRVPDGFATTSGAYGKFLAANGLEADISRSISELRSGRCLYALRDCHPRVDVGRGVSGRAYSEPQAEQVQPVRAFTSDDYLSLVDGRPREVGLMNPAGVPGRHG